MFEIFHNKTLIKRWIKKMLLYLEIIHYVVK